MTPTVGGTEAGARPSSEFGLSSVAAATPAAGGGWWVLERDLQGQGGVVYRYDFGWEATGEAQRLRLANASDPYPEFSPTDLAPASGDGWWVLDDRGRAHRFTTDFVHTGETHRLPEPGSEYNATSAYGFVAVPEGGWWLAASRDLWRTDEGWRPANDTVVSIGGGGNGYPVAVAYGSEASLWVLRGYLGRSVDRLRLDEDGTGVRDFDYPDTGSHPLSKLAVSQSTHDLEAPDTPVDVVRGDRGWWIIDADGQIHHHDRYWRYTGITRPVGSPSSRSSYPADTVSPAIVFVPIVVGLVWVAPGLVVVAGLLWRRRGVDQRWRLAGGAGALLFVYGVVVQPQFLRPFVFASVTFPLPVAVLALALPAGHVLATARRDGWYSAKPLVVTYAPVIVAALSMLGPALRPFLAPY